MLLVDKHRACMQIPVDQRLCIVHKLEFQLGSFQMKGLVLVQFLFYKFCIGWKYIVPVVVINKWLAVHQVL